MAEEAVSPISAAKPPVASPISAAKPPVATPIAPVAGGHAATLKLKPVIRKPAPGGAPALSNVKIPVPAAAGAPAAAPAPAAPKSEPQKALDQLKSVTQRLKGVTQEIPQQAILRKTGIIADQAMTDAQKQASKARTARISLSDAFGAAPVKNENAPMKTIRIKRPVDLPSPAAAAPAIAPAAAEPPPPAAAEPPPVDSGATLTQRKTLKVSRPGAGGAKFGIKKPGAPAPAKPAAPAEGAGEVAEIPDIPDMPAHAPIAPPVAQRGEKDVPLAVGILSLVVQIAACLVIGALGFFLYRDCQTPPF